MEAARPRSPETFAPAPHLASSPAPASPTLAMFAASLNGSVVVPGDEAYDTARQIRSTAVDRRPTLIVRGAYSLKRSSFQGSASLW